MVLEGNTISHGLIISHDTDEQDFTPNYQEDKAQIQQNWTFSTSLNDVSHLHDVYLICKLLQGKPNSYCSFCALMFAQFVWRIFI